MQKKCSLMLSLFVVIALICSFSLSSYAYGIDDNIIIIFSNDTEVFRIESSTLSSLQIAASNSSDDVITHTQNTTKVKTPGGSAVTVLIANRDFDSAYISFLNQQTYNGCALYATRLGNASAKYNCHSYAWYQASTSNPYWINDPSIYISDKSYVEVSSPQAGDIACYYNAKKELIHSAIVEAVAAGPSNPNCDIEGSDLILMRSKWGSGALYRHQGNCCPYVKTYCGDGDMAVSLKYYRVNKHNCTVWEPYSSQYHKGVCQDYNCGKVIYNTHTFTTVGALQVCSVCKYKYNPGDSINDINSINGNQVLRQTQDVNTGFWNMAENVDSVDIFGSVASSYIGHLEASADQEAITELVDLCRAHCSIEKEESSASFPSLFPFYSPDLPEQPITVRMRTSEEASIYLWVWKDGRVVYSDSAMEEGNACYSGKADIDLFGYLKDRYPVFV